MTFFQLKRSHFWCITAQVNWKIEIQTKQNNWGIMIQPRAKRAKIFWELECNLTNFSYFWPFSIISDLWKCIFFEKLFQTIPNFVYFPNEWRKIWLRSEISSEFLTWSEIDDFCSLQLCLINILHWIFDELVKPFGKMISKK